MIYGRGFQNEASLYFVEWHGVSPQSDVASYRYYVSSKVMENSQDICTQTAASSSRRPAKDLVPLDACRNDE